MGIFDGLVLQPDGSTVELLGLWFDAATIRRAREDGHLCLNLVHEAMRCLHSRGQFLYLCHQPFYYDTRGDRHVYLGHYGNVQAVGRWLGLRAVCGCGAFIKERFGCGPSSILGKTIRSAMQREAADSNATGERCLTSSGRPTNVL